MKISDTCCVRIHTVISCDLWCDGKTETEVRGQIKGSKRSADQECTHSTKLTLNWCHLEFSKSTISHFIRNKPASCVNCNWIGRPTILLYFLSWYTGIGLHVFSEPECTSHCILTWHHRSIDVVFVALWANLSDVLPPLWHFLLGPLSLSHQGLPDQLHRTLGSHQTKLERNIFVLCSLTAEIWHLYVVCSNIITQWLKSSLWINK